MAPHSVDPSPRTLLLDAVRTGACRSLTSWPELRRIRELVSLHETPQDPLFHAEGDVLTHTDMVLAQCPALEPLLPRALDGETLRLAALLHDIAKPECTRMDPALGRLVARGHERIGGVRARYLLHSLALPGPQRRLVAELVATHHLLRACVRGADAPEGRAALWRLAHRVDTRLLWALERADMLGRECADRDALVEQVELFRLVCEEQQCFGTPPPPWLDDEALAPVRFASPEARAWCAAEVERRRLEGTLASPAQALAFCYEHSAHKPAHMIVTVGPSASGKSTLAERLPGSFVRISTDAERERRFGTADTQREQGEVHAHCMGQLREVLRRGGQGLYDATNVLPELRARVLKLCHEYRAWVTLWVFDVPEATLFARNRARSRHVPEGVLARQCARFEWPLPHEAHRVHVFDGSEELSRDTPPT